MRGFEFPEELLRRPSSAFARVFEPLPDAFASVSLCRDIQQALVRPRVLNDRRSLSVHGQYNGPLALLDL